MAPEEPARRVQSGEGSGKRSSMLGVTAYLLVPGERRRRATGHFSRAAIEAAKGVRALSIPQRPTEKDRDEAVDGTGSFGGRQRIEIE